MEWAKANRSAAEPLTEFVQSPSLPAGGGGEKLCTAGLKRSSHIFQQCLIYLICVYELKYPLKSDAVIYVTVNQMECCINLQNVARFVTPWMLLFVLCVVVASCSLGDAFQCIRDVCVVGRSVGGRLLSVSPCSSQLHCNKPLPHAQGGGVHIHQSRPLRPSCSLTSTQ